MQKHEQWSSKIGFILAAAGSAIGLGAIWKFPYMAGTNGGAAFFLLFIAFTLFIGAPILIAEFVIGRNAQKDAVSAYKVIAPNSKWFLLGWMGVIASVLLLSFYSVVGGWILSYLGRSLLGQITGVANYESLFNNIIENPYESIISQILFILLTIWVVQGGIKKGIERASKYMMPALFILFIILAVRSLTLDGAMEGVRFFLQPDFNKITGESVLLALGQAFFALSVGTSVMVTYASYLPKNENLMKSGFSVVGLNILISLLAGLVIFPAVFALGYDPASGPGLVFVILPAVFNEIAFGGFFMIIFMVLLLFATLTSAFSILEIVVAVISKENPEKRKSSAWLAGIITFIVGIPSALSYGILSDVHIAGKTFFDLADFIVSNLALPLGSLFISIFIGYVMDKNAVRTELQNGSKLKYWMFNGWYILVRYVCPAAILLVFLNSIGII
ncbi:sodium-dependent transporter [Pradoshia sp. D12]|uniref:sodium-dependent transporter n=1 Tax=Bacillaceae TaxID=186817 RepID=UPI00112829B4|nr:MULTISPECIES: sodium-dependent transporter [Bacillaceae]QFK72651.1 sodium-dependent transporter [Pradoshia sp. D12]TPF71645.1 sodium-dependent transporter [Bacillus sp. D12]